MRHKKKNYCYLALVLSLVMCRFTYAKETLFVDKSSKYTYDEMQKDLTVLEKKYGKWMRCDSIGKTYDGRELPHILIGSENASEHILVIASIHGREYITSQLVMKQAAAFLEGLQDEVMYQGISYEELIKDKAIHIVPMSNPDGVTLSQIGLEGMNNSQTRQTIYRIYELDEVVELSDYLVKWKSNAQGVDINRNFDAQWEVYQDNLGHPSSDHYKGEAPSCTAESTALVALTEKYPIMRTISYHAQGNVIYWYFGQTGECLNESKKFADLISKITGYGTDANYEKLDPAGYKDWAISKYQIPSLTIEVGSGSVPVNPNQFPTIWNQNKHVLAATLYSMENQ